MASRELLPYLAWLDSLRGLLKKDEARRSGHLSPFFTPTKEMQYPNDSRGKLGRTLMEHVHYTHGHLSRAKRYVFPDIFKVYDEDRWDTLDELSNRVTHLPFEEVYFQIPEPCIFEDQTIPANPERYWLFLLTVFEEDRTAPVDQASGWSLHWSITRSNPSAPYRYTAEFVPAAIAHGWSPSNQQYEVATGCYSGFQPSEKIGDQGVDDLYGTVFTAACSAIDVLTNYPVEYHEAPGLKLVSGKSKIKPAQKIAHSIVYLGDHYYKKVAEDREEREKIRKRQHDVAGHWRHYKNGRRVWIKSHKRGDPTLGVVESEYQVSRPDTKLSRVVHASPP